MREIEFTSDSASVRYFGFDQLQESAITFSHTSENFFGGLNIQVDTDIYLLKTSNFRRLIAHLLRKENVENTHIVVTEIPNLSLLGLSIESFPARTIFLTLSEFTNFLITKNETHSIFEAVLQQASSTEGFFNDSSLTRSQLDLLIHISNGHTNVEISRLMFLTEKGVESAIKRLSLKLGCDGAYQKQQNLRILLGRRYAQLLGVLS